VNEKVHAITLGGKTRTLKYDYDDLERIEKMLGMPIYAAVTETPTAATRHVLIWAGIKHEEGKRFTPADVAAMCLAHIQGGGDFVDLYPPVRRAVGESGLCGIRFTFDEESGEMRMLTGKAEEATPPA
jgi:hypothetical protein